MTKGKIGRALFYIICSIVILQSAIFIGSSSPDERRPAKKILFIGDSMTGWLAERLNAYGEENGFDVSTIVWDGSTIAKWASSSKLPDIIEQQNPDAVFISLGMNELFEAHPEKRLKTPVDKIKTAIGERPFLWIGPPSWPGHSQGEILNEWLENELGSEEFFRSFDLKLSRQSAKNPHPTRAGMIEWMDSVVNWMPDNAKVVLPGIRKPEGSEMSRGKSFIYKRMKETL